MNQSVFTWPTRVYYEDTDAGGVVYYANYLKFMERARTEWLRNAGFEQDQLRTEHQVLFAVRSIDVKYKAPARFNDKLIITIDDFAIRRASITMQQSVLKKNNVSDELITTGHVNIVCVNSVDFSPSVIPPFIVSELNKCNPI
jgi:acyl-CoA thioester hydrolase